MGLLPNLSAAIFKCHGVLCNVSVQRLLDIEILHRNPRVLFVPSDAGRRGHKLLLESGRHSVSGVEPLRHVQFVESNSPSDQLHPYFSGLRPPGLFPRSLLHTVLFHDAAERLTLPPSTARLN